MAGAPVAEQMGKPGLCGEGEGRSAFLEHAEALKQAGCDIKANACLKPFTSQIDGAFVPWAAQCSLESVRIPGGIACLRSGESYLLITSPIFKQAQAWNRVQYVYLCPAPARLERRLEATRSATEPRCAGLFRFYRGRALPPQMAPSTVRGPAAYRPGPLYGSVRRRYDKKSYFSFSGLPVYWKYKNSWHDARKGRFQPHA